MEIDISVLLDYTRQQALGESLEIIDDTFNKFIRDLNKSDKPESELNSLRNIVGVFKMDIDDVIGSTKERMEREAVKKMFEELGIKDLTLGELTDKLNKLEDKGYEIHIKGKGNGFIKFDSD